MHEDPLIVEVDPGFEKKPKKAARPSRHEITQGEIERRRIERCASATGVANPATYWKFQHKVVLTGEVFMQLELLGEITLPSTPFVLAPNHSSFLDIPTAGKIHLIMAWPCKPAFVITERLARSNQENGAVPFSRKKDFDKPPSRLGVVMARLRRKPYVRLVDKVLTRNEMMDVIVDALGYVPAVVFAQGERKASAESANWFPGAAIAAIRADVPLIPMAVYGLGKKDTHKRTAFGLRRRAVAIVLDPILPSDYAHFGDEKAQAIAMMEAWSESLSAGLVQAKTRLHAKHPPDF